MAQFRLNPWLSAQFFTVSGYCHPVAYAVCAVDILEPLLSGIRLISPRPYSRLEIFIVHLAQDTRSFVRNTQRVIALVRGLVSR